LVFSTKSVSWSRRKRAASLSEAMMASVSDLGSASQYSRYSNPRPGVSVEQLSLAAAGI
jgi:hypothetical protein